ncbi:hypothetical protein [Prosthecobacter sp.]|uniref:hypothetical protein n=1 Tax=Prosthecobacter sp. TaxID=1965333 RepID=UPI003784D389
MTSDLPTYADARKALRFAFRLALAGGLLLAAPLASAQSADTDTSNLTATTASTVSGATILVNNTSGAALTGITIVNGDSLIRSSDSLTFGTLTFGTATTTAADNTTSNTSQFVIDPLTVTGGTISLANTTTNTTQTVTDPLTLGSSLTLTSGSSLSMTTATAGTLQVASGLTLSSATTTISSGTLSLTNAVNGALSVNGGLSSGQLNLTNTYGSSLVVNGSTIGAISSNTLTLNNGGIVDLTSLYSSGLNLTIGVIGSNASVLTLATTSSGVSIGIGGSSTTSSSGTITVSALGSLPAGNTPSSATFTTPAVSLIGVGSLGSQSITERGVIYSQTSANTAPTVGDPGVVKVVHTGTAASGGSFSLTAAGLAPSTSYTYRVYATDSTGATYLSQPSTFTTPSVLQNWRQTFFGTTQAAAQAADNADPDGDGVPNLMEFATGKNPTTAQNAAASATTAINAGVLEYTYTRSLDAVASGTTFSVEWNDSLNPSQWSSTGVTEAVLSDNGLVQQVKASIPLGATGRRFVRLSVLPPAQ